VTNLFEAARLARLDRVIFASTVGTFGYQDGYGPEPITEETETRAPKSLYGLMKLVNNGMAERYAKTFRQSPLRRRHRARQYRLLAADDSTSRARETGLCQLAIRRAA
jgi:nucleoside-diphosphate-sugar epimerase